MLDRPSLRGRVVHATVGLFTLILLLALRWAGSATPVMASEGAPRIADLRLRLCGGSLPQSAIRSPKSGGPRIHLPILRRDLGEVAAGEPLEVVFPLSNTGTEELRIEETLVTCHCMNTTCPKTLKPGEAGVLTVQVANHALSSEPINQQVTIVSNDPDQPRVTLEIVAKLRPLFGFSPKNPASITYKKGAVIRQLFTVTAADPSVRITRVQPGGPDMEAQLLPQESADPAGTWRVEVMARPRQDRSDYSGMVLLYTTHPKVPMVPITIWGIAEDAVQNQAPAAP